MSLADIQACFFIRVNLKQLGQIQRTVSQESVLDEQDSQWQWYMSNESSRSALFNNANIKIVFVQIKK